MIICFHKIVVTFGKTVGMSSVFHWNSAFLDVSYFPNINSLSLNHQHICCLRVLWIACFSENHIACDQGRHSARYW